MDDNFVTYYQRGLVEVFSAVRDLYGNILLDEEQRLINLILCLPCHPQRLLFRLLLRKDQWLRVNRLDYSDIELAGAVATLGEQGILAEPPPNPSALLECLTMEELKQLAKQTLAVRSVTGNREQIVNRLLSAKPSGQTRLIFHGGKLTSITPPSSSASPTQWLLEAINRLTGPLIRLGKEVRALWEQCAALFLLNVEPASTDNASTVILASLRRVQYPKYQVLRTEQPFADRQAWLDYREAIAFEASAHEAIESKVHELEGLLETCLAHWRKACGVPLPASYFLRRYQAGWVYTRTLSAMVSWLETADRHPQANQLLLELLGQEHYCLGRRGGWWERLVLNLQRHLKDKSAALSHCEQALRDPHLRTGHRLSLTRRQRMLAGEDHAQREIPTKVIPATPLATGDGKLRYLIEATGEAGRVEEMVMEAFKAEGWTIGWHTEASVYTTLFALCFWDLLFTLPFPNVFLHPYQSTTFLFYCSPSAGLAD